MGRIRSAVVLVITALIAVPALAEEAAPAAQDWSFSGIFGTYDRAALRRGFQVYHDVCSACHSLNRVRYRDLQEIGFSEDEAKALAAEKKVTDGPNDQGQMFERPARLADAIVPPFANEPLARLANNGALPPDLSLIVKARKGGADYVDAILIGFVDAPPDAKIPDGMFYNAAFPGHAIAMPPPLVDGAVTYADKTPATVPQLAHDVVTFLNWAAEPELEARKKMGLRVMIYLVLLTAMLYAVKRKVWSKLH
ncbi:MAG: cytochrome c1 [Alphaproteobacteria bacterium]